MEDDEPEQRSRAGQLQELLLESFAAGMEGLMLKTLDAGAAYQPSKRSDSWVKLKRWCCCSLRESRHALVFCGVTDRADRGFDNSCMKTPGGLHNLQELVNCWGTWEVTWHPGKQTCLLWWEHPRVASCQEQLLQRPLHG